MILFCITKGILVDMIMIDTFVYQSKHEVKKKYIIHPNEKFSIKLFL